VLAAWRSNRGARIVDAVEHERLSTGIGELDSVLGGGLVPGSLVLIGGAPGIGKSTLTTMTLANLTAAGRRTLYVSAEESAAQIRLRAERPHRRGRAGDPGDRRDRSRRRDRHSRGRAARGLRDRLCADASLRRVDERCGLRGAGAPGRRRDHAVAKTLRICVLLVGHVTKEGALAGPRVLEHLVRLRAPVRGRAGADLPDGAGDQETASARPTKRACLRCVTPAGRGARRLGPFRRRGDEIARLRRAVRDGRLAAATGRGPGARIAIGAGAAAAGRQRLLTQPARAGAGRPRPSRWDRARRG